MPAPPAVSRYMPADGDTSFGCFALGPSIVGGKASRDRASSGMSLFSRLRLSCNLFPLALFLLSTLDQFLPSTIIHFSHRLSIGSCDNGLLGRKAMVHPD